MKVFIERAETEKIDKKNQYAGIANTHHLPEHIQEQPRQSEKTDVKVYIVGNRTEELNVEKQNAGSTAPAANENNHAESEKIAVKVYLERAETEEIAVEQ